MPELKPKLTVNTGGMFASKSSALINQGERHILAGHDVLYIKPVNDNRYSSSSITTHKGETVEAVSVENLEDLIYKPDLIGAEVVLIDEAQFFKNLEGVVKNLLRTGKAVYVSGLDMDYRGDPFVNMAITMAMADEVNKLKAVCSGCGADSTHSAKLSGSDAERVEIGGTGMYEPMCRECHLYYENNIRGEF